MPYPKTFSGLLPLMQVSQQQPRQDLDQRTDPRKFRLNLHTFIDNRSYSVPSSNVVSDSSGHDGKKSSPYKRIAFAPTNVAGQIKTDDADPSSSKPKRKKRRTAHNPTKIRLRTSKPMSASSDMHADAWSIILAHTRPAFIMQMRTVSKFFYHITNTDIIWRHAREHHFGVDMPPRPSFLTERQYASLLDGRGCQNPTCERRETRKVRWVFRLRLCDECLSRKLDIYKNDGFPSPQSHYAAMFENPADREQYGTSLVDLLPTSGTWSGKPNAPRSVSRDTGKWVSRFISVSPLLYLKSDFVVLQQEYTKIQEENWEAQRVLDWVREKYEYATNIARTASELEWWEFRRFSDNMRMGSTRMQRQSFFVDKAAQLTPPITRDVLCCFSAFHTSLASSNPPSERAWDTLRAKILPYRSLAEEVVQYMNTRYARFGQPSISSSETSLFDQLHEHRKIKRKETGDWNPEQRFVIDLAEREFDKLVDEVADEDLLLLCLREVYRAFQQAPNKPEGLNFDGITGEYRLSLDDAKIVVEEVIEKRIQRLTLRGVKVLESLRCMGCTRFSSGKRYSFQSAFEHMLDKHSKLVGKDLHFHRFLKYSKVPPDCLSKDYRFPWYLVEWTRSLPLLPSHAEINSETRWIPDEDAPYTQMTQPNMMSAFEGRRAVRIDDDSRTDFVSTFVHAAKIMSTTRLDSESVVKIAIRYGRELLDEGEPSMDDFLACIKPTQDLGSGLHFKFRCGACNLRPEVNSHLRCVKHSVEINILRKHWNDKHAHEGIDWVTNFMDLPSDTALLDIMLATDDKLRQDQASSIERETVGLKRSARKVPDQKASALMHKELAFVAFGRLFAALSS